MSTETGHDTPPVWSATVDDNTYECIVTRTGDYTGLLSVSRTADAAVIYGPLTVALAYGARFGPDVDDVARWQDWCIEAIDADRLLEDDYDR